MHYPATTLLRTKWREGLGTFCPRVSSYMIEGYYRRADIDLSVAIEGGGILLITLLIAAAALIGGGVVVYRHSKGVGWRAGGMSALAVGISLLLFLATVFPIRSGGEAQEPIVSYEPAMSSEPGDAGSTSQVKARLGEAFLLPIGQTASITGENLRITFDDVTEDSRCPKNVTCIWEGRVTCVVRLTHGDSAHTMILTEYGLADQDAKEHYKEYQLAFHVQPYPEEPVPIPKNEYQLLLVVSRR